MTDNVIYGHFKSHPLSSNLELRKMKRLAKTLIIVLNIPDTLPLTSLIGSGVEDTNEEAILYWMNQNPHLIREYCGRAPDWAILLDDKLQSILSTYN